MSRWVDGLEERARACLPEPVHRYFRQGARDGVSTAEAAAAWDGYRLLPRTMRDVTVVDTGTTLLGSQLRGPVAVAPTTLQRAAHAEGELAMARAAASAGSLVVVSSNAGTGFEAIGGTGAPWWLQMYLPQTRQRGRPVLDRAVAAGARAVVLTVDTPVVGTKYDEAGPSVWEVVDPSMLRVNFPDGYGTQPGDEKAADLGAEDVAWLTRVTGLPDVVKGVLRGDDARRWVEAGAAAVWVSNHGGRQLDFTAAPADCLADVADAVGAGAEVYVDGGVRSGRHALVALALGAQAVFVGRPPLYALAAAGQDGVETLLEELLAELVDCLRLAGATRPDEVTRDLLVGRPKGGPSATADASAGV